ncbi:MAG: glycoside hydrolase family 9 protein [Polyangiaceae bacterium]|nr:glycoside hydrolase family 9 protein [Polyangiaceae bacterium]
MRSLGLAPLLGLFALSSAARAADTDLRFCSIGYVPQQAKRATVLGTATGTFVVRRTADSSEAFIGELEARGGDATADFSALTEEGSFVLEVPGVGQSAAFPIGVEAYVGPYRTAMLGFYGWRSGVDVSISYGGHSWFHTAGHLQDAYLDFLGEPGVIADGTGGWYDAGDYGKYIVNSGITMGLLLQAWEDFRTDLEPITLQIPETGGSLPDYLAELRFQLDWMLKMQLDDGSVSHKITPVDFPGFIQPVEDTERRYFSPWGSAATADLAATAAKAARTFREFDASYADTLQAAALRSYEFLGANPADHRADLGDFEQAQYQTSDRDDRVWAAAEIWETTGDASALADFESRVVALEDLVSADWDWGNPSNLGVFTYLRSARSGRSESVVESLEAALLSVADGHVSSGNASSYGRALPAVYWGSNGTVARLCATLEVAHRLTDDAKYLGTCADQIAHLFGRNEYGRSQVTGVGINPPLHPHDRRSGSDGIDPPYPGYLVGGASKPGNWLDEQESYETNEIAINWQGALVYALAGFVTAPRGPAGGAGAAGAPTSATGGSTTTPNASGGGPATATGGGAGVASSRDEAADDRGCACRAARRGSAAWWVVAALAAFGAAARRRRPGQRPVPRPARRAPMVGSSPARRRAAALGT